MKRLSFIAALVISVCGYARADLFDYIALEDDSFEYTVGDTAEAEQGRILSIDLTSQTWHGIVWKHRVRVYEPKEIGSSDVLGLMITGGGPGAGPDALGLRLANMMGGRFAVLYDIPNQPLFDNLREDALISYTWMQYLLTGDETWPLLFPMTKSAVRAMDCLQNVAQDQWNTDIRGFVVTGASKRGWTTYLTGIADPKRVIGIAPMVFDILNLNVSVEHQRDFWGSYSPEIGDYTEKGLTTVFGTERGFRLSFITDPYSYRDRLTMPKLLILGSNDPYWPTDAVNLYYVGLPAPRALLIAPNSGHGLNDQGRVTSSLAAFYRTVARGEKLPPMSWLYTESPEGLKLSVTTDGTETGARVWTATSSVQDFRPCKWTELPLARNGDALVGTIPRAEGAYTACYGEVVFPVDGEPLYLSTQPRVMHPVAK